MILQKNNSNIYQSPEEHLLDFSPMGSYTKEEPEIKIQQEAHYFKVGDVLYFDIKNNKFSKALAINNIESEVCGVVSEVPDNNEFVLMTEGDLKTDRYKFTNSAILYLSEVVPGALMSANPTAVLKEVATQINGGIRIAIKTGYFISDKPLEVILQPYTKAELDDIILNVKGVT